MKKGPHSAKEPGTGGEVPEAEAKPAPVLLTKRTPAVPPDPKAPREKICSECGTHFKVETGQKFFLCPDCYRRSFTYKRKGGKEAARVLIHITCAACGAQEYLPFLPDEPDKALCRACFAKERPEPKPAPRHPSR
jgi:CxxC-x17-CxxC domain-containing protein